MAGLTLLDDGQGSGKQKWKKGLGFHHVKDSPALRLGRVVGEGGSSQLLPGRSCHAGTPGGLDHAGNLLQSLVLSHGILKSYEKEGNSCVRHPPTIPLLHPLTLCNPQVPAQL